MGVLNKLGPLQEPEDARGLHSVTWVDDSVPAEPESPTSPTQERKTKSSRKQRTSSYDFRDSGVDSRRKGCRHQRRKENLSDLLANIGCLEDLDDDVFAPEESNSSFSELFLDHEKMNAWQQFVGLSEDNQQRFLDGEKSEKLEQLPKNLKGSENFERMDKKIQDMVRSKVLAQELLEYYETDILKHFNESKVGSEAGGDFFEEGSVMVMDIESSYHRLCIYGLCQYMKLQVSTTKQCDTSLLEIQSNDLRWSAPDPLLTKYYNSLVGKQQRARRNNTTSHKKSHKSQSR